MSYINGKRNTEHSSNKYLVLFLNVFVRFPTSLPHSPYM
jgi:hypothetical protein